MISRSSSTVPDLALDPFGERVPVAVSATLQLLGGQFRFESNSEELLQLALHAFDRLPRHRLSRTVPRMCVRLLLSGAQGGDRRLRSSRQGATEPPPLTMFSSVGLLGGATDSSNLVAILPRERSALVVVSPRMLQFPYHIRYELIEFAVYTLAARVQSLVPLHAACVGRAGRGVLLMGPSGAGKSTVTLQCLVSGLDFLAEDSLFVEPRTMLATAVANFIHVRSDSLRWLEGTAALNVIRKSPVIRRRSGVQKFEVDLRHGHFQLAPRPLQIEALVFLSADNAGGPRLLRSLRPPTVRRQLTLAQAYASAQPEWSAFLRKTAPLPAFELRRGRHPQESVDALNELLR